MIQAIDRAARVLGALQGSRHLGITELGVLLELPPSTVHGIVKSLQTHGLVAKEPYGQRYMLGPTLLQLSNVYLDTLDVRARALRWTGDLSERTGLAVRMGVEFFDEVIVIHHEPRPDGSRQMPETGLTIPAHASALGKVLLAYRPDFRARSPRRRAAAQPHRRDHRRPGRPRGGARRGRRAGLRRRGRGGGPRRGVGRGPGRGPGRGRGGGDRGGAPRERPAGEPGRADRPAGVRAQRLPGARCRGLAPGGRARHRVRVGAFGVVERARRRRTLLTGSTR